MSALIGSLRGAGIESPEVLLLRAQDATLGLSSVLGSQTQHLVHTRLSSSLTLTSFESRSCCVAQANLELMILLLWEHKCVTPCLA